MSQRAPCTARVLVGGDAASAVVRGVWVWCAEVRCGTCRFIIGSLDMGVQPAGREGARLGRLVCWFLPLSVEDASSPSNGGPIVLC